MKKLLVGIFTLAFCSVTAQGFLKKLGENKLVGGVLEGKPAISTNFRDVELKDKMPPEFGDNANYINIFSLPKNAGGTYDLSPGFYQTINLSYCLKAGTHGPAKGDAYGSAPILGKMSDIVTTILVQSQAMWRKNNSAGLTAGSLSSTFITQQDVQLLLWAIIAKADFEDMQNKTKAVAMALLSPEQIVKLNGGAVKSVVNFAGEKGWMEKPQWLRTIEEAEQSMRQLYKSSTSTYEDFERLAVLSGMNAEAQPVEFGTWFKHKDGFYIRFEPNGYSRTHVKIYVPEGRQVNLKITGIIATPSDSRQRLAQTDISEEDYKKPN